MDTRPSCTICGKPLHLDDRLAGRKAHDQCNDSLSSPVTGGNAPAHGELDSESEELLTDNLILLSHEREISVFTGGLTLTSHRVRMKSGRWGSGLFTSIMLEELKSCQLRWSSHPWLLVLAGLAALGGLASSFSGGEGAGAGAAVGIVAAVVFGVIYLLTRRHVLSLASGGAAIVVSVGGNSDALRDFIHNVEEAKNERYLLLAKEYSVSR